MANENQQIFLALAVIVFRESEIAFPFFAGLIWARGLGVMLEFREKSVSCTQHFYLKERNKRKAVVKKACTFCLIIDGKHKLRAQKSKRAIEKIGKTVFQ